MRYIESPTPWTPDDPRTPSIFLAGGITNCPDWQTDAALHMYDQPVTLLNPRQANFNVRDKDAAPAQIKWEFDHLHLADVILFWFPTGEVTQPIAQYELGRYAALNRPIAVGVEPGYIRETDVHIQLAHARPDVVVESSLGGTCLRALKLACG